MHTTYKTPYVNREYALYAMCKKTCITNIITISLGLLLKLFLFSTFCITFAVLCESSYFSYFFFSTVQKLLLIQITQALSINTKNALKNKHRKKPLKPTNQGKKEKCRNMYLNTTDREEQRGKKAKRRKT